jgi:chromosome segregation ATPase
VARYVKQLDSVVAEFANKTSDNFKIFSEEASKFNLISEKLVSSVESLVERVNQVNAPSDLLATKLSPSVDAIAEAADEVRKRAKADKAAVEKLTVAITGLAKVSEEAEGRVQAIALEGARAEETYKRLADIADKFDQAANAARANIEHTHSTMQTFDKLGNSLEAAVTEAGERIVQGADKVVSGQKDMLRQVEETFSTSLQQIRNHNTALAAELERSKQYTVTVHSELVTMTRALTKQVNGEE